MADWVTGVIGGLSAIAGGAATQGFALWKESRVSQQARFRDMQFIVVELLLKLTELHGYCRKISEDHGQPCLDSKTGETGTIASVSTERFTLEDIQGKWDALPAELLFRIRELPLALTRIERHLSDFDEFCYDPPHHPEYFERRRSLYGKQAERIEELTRQLRKRCKLPDDNDANE